VLVSGPLSAKFPPLAQTSSYATGWLHTKTGPSQVGEVVTLSVCLKLFRGTDMVFGIFPTVSRSTQYQQDLTTSTPPKYTKPRFDCLGIQMK